MWYRLVKIGIIFFFFLTDIFPWKSSYYTYIEGLTELQKGNYEEAIKKFELTLHQDPSAIEVYKHLVHLYTLTGKIENFSRLLPQFLEFVEDVDLLTTVGNLLWLSGKIDEAEKVYNKILAINPNNKDAVIGLGQIYFSSYTEKSVKLYSEYLNSYPEDVDIMFKLALAKYKLNEIDVAIDIFKKILELRPDFYSVKLILADLLLTNTGYYSEIEKFYLEHLEYNPEDYTTISKLLILYLSSGRINDAEKYIKLIEKIPEKKLSVELLYLLSLFYEQKKIFPKAIKYMERYVSLKKDVGSWVYTKLGYYYYMLKKYKKAEKWYKYIYKTFKDEKSFLPLTFLYLDTKQFRKAIKILKEIEQKQLSFDRLYFYLGYCYDQIGRFDIAEKYFLKSIEINPEDHESLNYLGYSYADRNIKLDLAEKYIKKALELDPDNPAYIDSLGWIYYRLGLYELAEKELVTAADKYPDPIIFDHVGDVKVKLGKYEEAKVYYRKALDLSPKDKKIKNKLKQLEKKYN